MRAHTPDDFALAKQLYDVAIAASYPGLMMKFEALNGNQIDGWIAVARHVVKTTIARDVIAAALARAKAREFFEDGLEADLGDIGVTTIAAAYAQGHKDGVDELAAEIAQEGAVQK